MNSLRFLICLSLVISVLTNRVAALTNPPTNIQSTQEQWLSDIISLSDTISSKLELPPVRQADIESELSLLRYFSYSYPPTQLDSSATIKLADMLLQLSEHPEFYADNEKSWRWQEQFSVLSYRYPVFKHQGSALLNVLSLISKKLPSEQLAAQYAWWESIRAKAFLQVEARRNSEMQDPLLGSEWPLQLLALIPLAADWQIEHLLWVLAYHHYLLATDSKAQFDQQVRAALLAHPTLTMRTKQELFSWRYLNNSFRVKDHCLREFQEWCVLPEIDQALPNQFTCHPGLVIRFRSITPPQLKQLCTKMIAQEDHFHTLLKSNKEPVANDLNQRLEVIIFDDYSDYNLYGALHFNIHTNNGGMYIEGTPSDPENQARFFAFQQFWQTEPFAVWNLEHEYIHYLDGRYASYGPFGHFPSHKVWWSEGLAELISKADDNPQALRLLMATAEADIPTLQHIFAASYDDGLDLTYRWSYLAWRFLQSELPASIPALAQTLRTDFFAGYLRQLEQLASKHNQDFIQFLQKLRNNHTLAPTEEGSPILGRYLYRSYLQPTHLPINKQHYHRLTHNPNDKEQAQ